MAAEGQLRVVPVGNALDALRYDYERMQDSGLVPDSAPGFDAVLAACVDLEQAANAAAHG